MAIKLRRMKISENEVQIQLGSIYLTRISVKYNLISYPNHSICQSFRGVILFRFSKDGKEDH